MITTEIYNQLLETALRLAKNSTGVDISNDSFTRNIFKALLNSEKKDINSLEALLKKFSFSNRTGNDLDELYENLFNIPRLSGSKINARYINFNINIDLQGRFLSGGIIFINGTAYEITDNKDFNSQVTVELKTAVNINYKKLIKLDNQIEIDINSIEIDTNIDKENVIQKSFLVLDEDYIDKESDSEYIRRANKILQNYGYNNLTKIQNQSSSIENLSNLLIEENSRSTNLIIIPSDFIHTDTVYNQLKELVDYFKGGEINIFKPSVTIFSVDGLRAQLIDWFSGNTEKLKEIETYISEIKADLKDYTDKLYLNKTSNKTIMFSQDNVEFIINKYFSNNNIIFSLNENKIATTYKSYKRGNYNTSILSGNIDRRVKKKIFTDICYFSDLN